MATPLETTSLTLALGGLAATGGYALTLYVQDDLDTLNLEPSNVKTFALTNNETLNNPYRNQFLDITRKENLSSIVKPTEENQEWWDWAYQLKYERYKSTIELDPLFQSINFGYSLDDKQSLNNVCDSVYKQDRSKFNNESNKLVSNVGAFCTTGSEFLDISEPEALVYGGDKAPENYSSGVLKVKTNRDKLVKTEEVNNKFWWDWAFKSLYAKKTGETSSDFENIDKSYSTQNNEKTALNQACNDGYKKVYFELKAPSIYKKALLNDLSNFCSINHSTSSIVFPDPDTPIFIQDNSSYISKSLAREGDNKNYLVDPDKEENKNWWIWSFDSFYPDQFDKPNKDLLVEPFEEIYFGYPTNKATEDLSLNNACKKAYNKVEKDFSTTSTKKKTLLINLIKGLCTTKEQALKLVVPKK